MPDSATTPRRHLSRLLQRVPSILILAVIWMLLWGEASVGTAVAGVFVGSCVFLVFPQPYVRWRFRIRLRPLAALAWYFVTHLITASLDVVRLAWRRGAMPPSGLVTVHLRPSSELFMAVAAGTTSLLPGTVAVETDMDRYVLYVHVLDMDQAGSSAQVCASEVALQTRLLRALATDAQVDAAGLTAGGSR